MVTVPTTKNSAGDVLSSRAMLLDASTVDFLSGHQIFHALTGPYFADGTIAKELYAVLVEYANASKVDPNSESDFYALTHALSFLEQWILADEMVVDRAAMESLASRNQASETINKLQGLFRVVNLSDSKKKVAAQNVVRFCDLMNEESNPLFSRYAAHGMVDADLPLKDDYFNDLSGTLGVSGNVPARALYYLELSGLLGTPLVIHPQKSAYIEKLSNAISHGIKTTYDKLVGRLNEVPLLHDFKLTIPPIADEILRVARVQRSSLVEAAHRVHDSAEMRSLRDAIWTTNAFAIANQRVRYEHELAQITDELTNAIQSRAIAGGRISRRTVNLSEVPAIGTVLKVFGLGRIQIPDVVLFEKPYIAIFSRWANEFRPDY